MGLFLEEHMTATATEPKTYYSRGSHFSIVVSAGRTALLEGGVVGRVEEKLVEFGPVGDGHGILVTDDPDTIAVLDRKVKQADGDVMTPEQYFERTTPPEKRVTELKGENARLAELLAETTRKLEDQNRLLADLKNGKIGSK